jgi:enoyl-CoA hydratase
MTTDGADPPVVKVERPLAGVGLVTLNRPDKRNALNPVLMDALAAGLVELDEDPEIRVVVVTGAGIAFSAGHDLVDIMESSATLGAEDRLAKLKHEVDCLMTVRTVLTPVIAAVNGAARGGGMALAAACDFRVAGESATFGTQFVNLGYSAGEAGLSWTLPRLLGTGVALKLMLLGESIGADEAHRIGLVEDVVPDDRLLDDALLRAQLIASHDRHALRVTKDAVINSLTLPFHEALDYESETALTTFVLNSETGRDDVDMHRSLPGRPGEV